MSYSCRVYINTGFNSSNIPDRPQLLDTCSFVDVSPLEIMQDRFLQDIRVKANWQQIQDADYLRLVNQTTGKMWFYSIEQISMQASDVALFKVIPDYINSIGGVSSLQIIDGITERVHVSDDSFGLYTETDPLTTPAEPLEISKVWVQVNESANTILESTIDIPLQMRETAGTTFTDTAETGEEVSVTVPTVLTDVQFDPLQTTFNLDGSEINVKQQTKCYNMTTVNTEEYKTLIAGLNRLRSLGVENALISQVSIPTEFVQVNMATPVTFDNGYIWTLVRDLTGKWTENDIDIPYSYTGAQNNRLNYGEFTKYGIITTSGESCEFDAEDIIETGKTHPTLRKVGDPRPNGKPYFRFKTVNGDSSLLGFFRNCISGLPWRNVPLLFREQSGNALNTLRYENSKNLSTNAYEYGTAQNELSNMTNVFNSLFSTAGSIGSGNIVGALQGVGNAFANDTRLTIEQMNRDISTTISRKNELSELALANNVVVPTVNFPMNAEFLRDFYGNGALVYRYLYSANDIARIDRLLTMYGYKFSKPLTKEDFFTRENFNFVLCRNVTVTGNSKWINDGVREQIANGVRVWHVLPSPTYYTNNPVKE